MNIREIENLIVEKLQQNFSDFQVIGFPEKPQEYILLHPIGAILVHYRGGSYSSTNSINFLSQDKKMEFGVTVVTRNLRSNSGSYETLDKIKNVLCGYKIAGCTKLTPTKKTSYPNKTEFGNMKFYLLLQPLALKKWRKYNAR